MKIGIQFWKCNSQGRLGLLLCVCFLIWITISFQGELRRSSSAFGQTSTPSQPSPTGDAQLQSQLRRPFGGTYQSSNHLLSVFNENTESVQQVDLSSGKILSERSSKVSDFSKIDHCLLGQSGIGNLNHLIATSPIPFALNSTLQVLKNTYPPELVLDPFNAPARSVGLLPIDSSRFLVSLRWKREVQVYSVQDTAMDGKEIPLQQEGRKLLDRVTVPFSPGVMIALPANHSVPPGCIVVADAFGGHLAIVNYESLKLVHLRELHGHNIRGLAISPDERFLLVSHQRLGQTIPATVENIQSGQVIANGIEIISIESLFESQPESHSSAPEIAGNFVPLDSLTGGAADPGAMVLVNGSLYAVVLGGTNEVLFFEILGANLHLRERVPVGARPVDLIPVDARRNVAVINSLDDSITVVDVATRLPIRTIFLSRQSPLTAQVRGERHFFNAKLSLESRMSCHSCHTDGHTNGLLADTRGDNTYGTPKRTLTLMGTALTYRWAWSGDVANLHDQVHKSIVDTMQGQVTSPEIVRDIVAFLHTLPPPPPRTPAISDELDLQSWTQGRELFLKLGCQTCHIPPLIYASHESFDVGLRDERGMTRFNPPSLRGVGQGRRFFHHNRASSLEDVFSKFNHPGDTILTDRECMDLVRYLNSL